MLRVWQQFKFLINIQKKTKKDLKMTIPILNYTFGVKFVLWQIPNQKKLLLCKFGRRDHRSNFFLPGNKKTDDLAVQQKNPMLIWPKGRGYSLQLHHVFQPARNIWKRSVSQEWRNPTWKPGSSCIKGG